MSSTATDKRQRAPVSDAIIIAVARLVDDAQSETREPSHSVGIDTLSGAGLTDALEAYVRRARRGSEDAALLLGTGKDLLEATAAHVISLRFGSYPQQSNFPT